LQPIDIQPGGQFWLDPPPSGQPGHRGTLVVKDVPPDDEALLPLPPAASSIAPNVDGPPDDVQAHGMAAAKVSATTVTRAP
jgi:hypothetical protein